MHFTIDNSTSSTIHGHREHVSIFQSHTLLQDAVSICIVYYLLSHVSISLQNLSLYKIVSHLHNPVERFSKVANRICRFRLGTDGDELFAL